MSSEFYDVVSSGGERVEVEFDPAAPQISIRFRGDVIRPRWGSQGSDDWLDWMASHRRGGTIPLPVDEPDWLQDEGYYQ